jgi:hypothetical protein
MPEKRGSNISIPYQHGTSFVTKFYDERTIQFGIAVIEATATALETQFNTIRALFSTMEPKVLEVTLEDASVRTVLASCEKPLQVKRMSNKNARIIVELTLHRPFFRSGTVIADNTTVVDESPESMTVTNPGTVEERDPTILLTGSLQNVVITNTSITPNVILTYTGTIAVAHWVSIATATTGEYTAIDNHGVNVIGNVTHSGSSALMVFAVGDNVLSITTDAGPGAVKASFYAPYL